tara:strand:- start:14588 stop:16426 length:1839 start_codon:yes stop_codon:yes gene_type:complete
MCGIAFAIGNQSVTDFIKQANHIQNHRGPDMQNTEIEKYRNFSIGFSHQRLSILDLSKSGEQPMTSKSGKLTILFNGEIYNYLELKKKFNLNIYKSKTDTEVALQLIEKIGIYEACRQFNGFWALIVYDRDLKKIYISRDRFGKKPLNYLYHNNCIYIASEIKSFYTIKGFSIQPNKLTVSRFLTQSLSNIDTNTWINNIISFPASSIGLIDLNHIDDGIKNIEKFWQVNINKDIKNKGYYYEQLIELLENSIKIRLHADVPVGVALSGGIDSSIIASITNKFQNTTNQKTSLFSVVNPGHKEDESYYINLLADYLDIDVKKFNFSPKNSDEFNKILKKCIYHNDGPIPSFSSLLFFKLMQFSKKIGIKVVLTGQGADEAFCGYNKYSLLYIKNLITKFNLIKATKVIIPFLNQNTLFNNFKFSEARRYIGHMNSKIIGSELLNDVVKENISEFNSISERQLLDIEKFSVPYLTHYEDRMSMAYSREIRSPFLDYRIVELGLNMPVNLKINSGWTKYCLRNTFENILPSKIAWRKDKMGFANPQDYWFKEILLDSCLKDMSDRNAPVYRYGFIDKNQYFKLLKKYINGDNRIWFRDVFTPYSLNIWLSSTFR